jgi:hypothetical protein
MKLKTEHMAIGALAITAIAGTAWYVQSKHRHALEAEYSAKVRHNSRMPGLPYKSHLAMARGDVSKGHPGISNVGIDAGGVGGWTAAGRKAGLDPSAWSYLTQKNENHTFSHTPSNKLLRPARIGQGPHKVQGAMGYTSYPWNAIYTIF